MTVVHRAVRIPRILRQTISDNAFALAGMLAALCTMLAVCRAESAMFSVESDPAQALVCVDGLVVGRTPMRALRVPEGSAVLTVSLDDHVPVVVELEGLAAGHDTILARLQPEISLPGGLVPELVPEFVSDREQMVELVLEVATQLEVGHYSRPDRRALLSRALAGTAEALASLGERVRLRVAVMGEHAFVHYGAMPALPVLAPPQVRESVDSRGVEIEIEIAASPPHSLTFGSDDSGCRRELLRGFTILESAFDPEHSQVGPSLLASMAIAGMLESIGDEHTHFFPADGVDDYSDVEGNVVSGIGLQLGCGADGSVVTTATLAGSPAESSGILPGTQVLAVDEQAPVPFAVEDTARRLRGPEGSSVSLMLGGGEDGIHRVEVVRELLRLSTTTSSYFESSSIGYLRLDGFPGPQVAEEFGEHLGAVLELGAHSIVIDLRGNAGGLLDQAVAIADMFLDEGVIVSTRSPLAELCSAAEASAAATSCPAEIGIAVLIDGGSASASEVLAGALQERGRAVVVGSRSYGKGTVQVLLPTYEADGAIALSVGTYHLPSGRSVHGHGVDPDLEVEVTATTRKRLRARSLYARDDPRQGDPPLVRALAHLARNHAAPEPNR